MKLREAKITILVGSESTTIELIDTLSSTTFAKVTLTPEQLSSALSRTAYTDCEINVYNVDRLNKKMELKDHVFEIPVASYRMDKSLLQQLATDTTPDGWKHDGYFGSQGSFFEKDGKSFARVTIRRWVELPNDERSVATEDQ